MLSFPYIFISELQKLKSENLLTKDHSETLDEKLKKLRNIFPTTDDMSCSPCVDDPKNLTLIDSSVELPSHELLDDVCSFLISKIYFSIIIFIS